MADAILEVFIGAGEQSNFSDRKGLGARGARLAGEAGRRDGRLRSLQKASSLLRGKSGVNGLLSDGAVAMTAADFSFSEEVAGGCEVLGRGGLVNAFADVGRASFATSAP